jgi:tetratricopeptide (TPR) repeat protein
VKLRNKTFVDHALNLHHQLSRGLPALASRTPFPSDAGDSIWRLQLTRVVAGEAASRAEQAVQADAENPNAWFTLGQARYLEAMAAADSRRQGEGLAASEKAFRQGRSVAPQDTALMFGLGRVLSDLGEFDEAQKVLARAIESDPNLGNGYAFYGYSLWSQRKLVRAEAYLRKALSLNGKAEFAASILDTIARLRILAKDPEYVDAFGDPMESFDLEPPTADDELRGVRINE